MKKLLLGLVIFQLFTFAAHAQIEKGSIMLGGNVNYTNNNSNSNSKLFLPDYTSSMDGRTNQFTFSPQIGYTLSNNWVMGTVITLYSSKATSDGSTTSGSSVNKSSSKTEQNSYGAGLFARKYLSFNEHFSAFGQLNASVSRVKNYNYSKSNSDIQESEQKYNAFRSDLAVGLAYFPKNWLAVELSSNLLQYSHSKNKRNTEEQDFEANNNTFAFGLNTSSINLGVSFFLNNK